VASRYLTDRDLDERGLFSQQHRYRLEREGKFPARIQLDRLGRNLHQLGPRPIAEAILAAIGHVAPDRREDALEAADRVAEIPAWLVEATDGREFCRPPMRVVAAEGGHTQRGNRYLSGFLGKARVVGFQGEPREDGTPTWKLYVAPGSDDRRTNGEHPDRPARKAVENAERFQRSRRAGDVLDDEIPF
jgi:hypothetical protein